MTKTRKPKAIDPEAIMNGPKPKLPPVGGWPKPPKPMATVNPGEGQPTSLTMTRCPDCGVKYVRETEHCGCKSIPGREPAQPTGSSLGWFKRKGLGRVF